MMPAWLMRSGTLRRVAKELHAYRIVIIDADTTAKPFIYKVVWDRETLWVAGINGLWELERKAAADAGKPSAWNVRKIRVAVGRSMGPKKRLALRKGGKWFERREYGR